MKQKKQRGDKWAVYFECTSLPMAEQPQPHLICCQGQTPPYSIKCRYRSHQKHWLFKYTLSGQGIFKDQNGEHRQTTGSGFLCRVNNPDIEYWCPENKNWEFIYLTFSGCDELANSVVEYLGPVFNIPREHSLVRKLLNFETEHGNVLSMHAADGAEIVNNLLWGLIRLKEETEQQTSSSYLVRHCRTLMRQNIASPYTMGDLADEMQISLPHLSRVFKAETGMGPLATFQKMKIEYAEELLQNSNLFIKEIAAMLGFENASNFTRSFRRLTGTSPKSKR